MVGQAEGLVQFTLIPFPHYPERHSALALNLCNLCNLWASKTQFLPYNFLAIQVPQLV